MQLISLNTISGNAYNRTNNINKCHLRFCLTSMNKSQARFTGKISLYTTTYVVICNVNVGKSIITRYTQAGSYSANSDLEIKLATTTKNFVLLASIIEPRAML